MRTTIFVALGRHSIFKASANAAVTYKLNTLSHKISTTDAICDSADEGTYRFRPVTAATGEESP